MNCDSVATHTIKAGDSLYAIARTHQTTVEELMALNPGLNPYNLQIGTVIQLCQPQMQLPVMPQPSQPAMPGMQMPSQTSQPSVPGMQPSRPTMPSYNINQLWMDLSEAVRLSWLQHSYWTRALLVSIMAGLEDQQAVQQRLMQNPADIMQVYRGEFPAAQVDQLQNLLTVHLQLGGALMNAVRDRNAAQVETLNRQWYRNADQIAEAFAAMNPQYDRGELQRMLYGHLALLKQEIFARADRRYPEEIRAFGAVESHILQMADYLAEGLGRQMTGR